MNAVVADADEARRAQAWHMRNMAAIQSLVNEVQRPLDEVAAVYQCELVRMASQAAVMDFLPVLVGKRVRRWYRHRLDALHQNDPCRLLIP